MTDENTSQGTLQEGQNASVRKKKVRGGHRAHTTKLFNEINTLLEKTYTQEYEGKFRDFKSRLQRKIDIISKLDESILDELENDNEIELEIEDAEQWHDNVRQKIREIDDILGKAMISKQEDVDEGRNTSEARPSATSAKIHVKLPKYDIEKFSGDPTKYLEFKDAFEVAIMRNSSLHDVEKFAYLRSFLAGDALRLIGGLAVTSENFRAAMQLIEKRFGNKQIIVNSHMEALIKVAPVKTADDNKGMRELYDKVETNLRSLEALGIESELYGSLLVPVLKAKIPNEIILLLSRKFTTDAEVWTIRDMMKELKAELEARERSGVIPERAKKDKELRQPTTTEGLLAQQAGQLSCPYCGQKHFPDKCRVVTNPQARKDILKSKKRCFICTKRLHIAKDCASKRTCFKC